MRIYSPADSADHAEECSKAVLFRRERQVDVCIVLELVSFWVLLFWVLSASSARSAGDILWFHLCNTD